MAEAALEEETPHMEDQEMTWRLNEVAMQLGSNSEAPVAMEMKFQSLEVLQALGRLEDARDVLQYLEREVVSQNLRAKEKMATSMMTSNKSQEWMVNDSMMAGDG